MADLQVLPVQADEVIGKTGVYVTPTYEERVPTNPNYQFEPYRIFKASGDLQQDISIRVDGLDKSDVPTKLSKVEFTGLKMMVQNVQSRGKTKREITFTATSMRLAK